MVWLGLAIPPYLALCLVLSGMCSWLVTPAKAGVQWLCAVVVAGRCCRSCAALPRPGRLRGGRFDRLPPLESLFFCWPKRKV